jgi:hypothetical protein
LAGKHISILTLLLANYPTTHLSSLTRINPRRKSIRPNSIRRKLRTQHLGHVGHRRLARTVRITNDILPGESGDAARGDDLALHVAFATNAVGVGVACVEEVQECDAGVERGHRVEAEGCVGVFEGGGPEGLLDIGDGGIAFILGERRYGSRDAGIGDENVDEGCLLLDGCDRCGEGVFGAGVTSDGDYRAVLLRGLSVSV